MVCQAGSPSLPPYLPTCTYLIYVYTYIVRPESPCRLLAHSRTRIDTQRASSNLGHARHVNEGNRTSVRLRTRVLHEFNHTWPARTRAITQVRTHTLMLVVRCDIPRMCGRVIILRVSASTRCAWRPRLSGRSIYTCIQRT